MEGLQHSLGKQATWVSIVMVFLSDPLPGASLVPTARDAFPVLSPHSHTQAAVLGILTVYLVLFGVLQATLSRHMAYCISSSSVDLVCIMKR